jgi:hypothetical protein
MMPVQVTMAIKEMPMKATGQMRSKSEVEILDSPTIAALCFFWVKQGND